MMKKQPHGNRLDNPKIHHLYFIYDFALRETYKFGISDKPIRSDNSSARLDEQIKLFNKVTGMPRFSGRILIKSIVGRRNARLLEDDVIRKFLDKHQRFPRGNEDHVFLGE